MLRFLCLFAVTATSIYAAPPNGLIIPRDLPILEPLCFDPPDRHNVSLVTATCHALFNTTIAKFGRNANENLRWGIHEVTGNGTVKLPYVDTYINADRTQACLMEITEPSIGDTFTPHSLIRAGQSVLSKCFVRNQCGEVPLPPHYTTQLAVCGSSDRVKLVKATGCT